MSRKTTVKLVGFVGALGISAALIAAASSTTGAYFTDSADGQLHGTSGQLQMNTNDTFMEFSALNPGQDVTKQIAVSLPAENTTKADLWMVFDPNSAGYGQFTGNKDATYGGFTGGGMGQYGHFKVVGLQGHQFESYNLQLPPQSPQGQTPYESSTAAGDCQVDADGNGGSSVQHTPGAGNDIPECGAPRAIKLAQGVTPGFSGHVSVTFGLTGKQTQQNQQDDPKVGFQIVATQPGQSPVGLQW
jgi:hypothetical protein